MEYPPLWMFTPVLEIQTCQTSGVSIYFVCLKFFQYQKAIMPEVIDQIIEVFRRRGDEKYADEKVTQLQHALQCGLLAKQSQQADSALITAALLHDIGHLLSEDDLPANCEMDLHDHHETLGYEFLLDSFGAAVAEPVKLHVAAKRYLCTVDADYLEQLSPTSLKSFEDQGGIMSEAEIEEFQSNPYFEASLRLRRWDDQAKVADSPDIGIAEFLGEMKESLQPSSV